MSAASGTAERSSDAPRLAVVERLGVLAAHRELLLNLIRRELKVKYAASVLGAVWSLLNPLVYLAVFSFVSRVLGATFPNYPVYLLSGLLAWNLFSSAVSGGARSVLENGNLVKKVAFPHEILPLAAAGVAVVDFALQSVVLLLFIVGMGHGIHLPELLLWPPAFVALLILAVALSLWLAAMNVRYRDVGHLLNIALLVWFWATPIVYAGYQAQEFTQGREILGVPAFTLYLLNPLASIAGAFQRAMYGVVHPAPSPEPVLFDVGLGWLALVVTAVAIVSLFVLRLAWGVFFARSGDFAEEL
jgi:ABC-2 type transport system permease protein